MPCNRRKVRAGRPRDRQPLVSGQAKTNRQRALAPEDLPHPVSLDGVEIFWARRRKEVLVRRPPTSSALL